MMKLIAIIVVVCISSAYGSNPLGLTDAHLEAIKHIDPTKLPAFFMAKRDNSHWCCVNDQPIGTIQKTHVVKEIHTVGTNVKVGYTNCGFAGLSRCSLYSKKYKQIAVYHVGTYEVPEENACFDHHVKCCLGFIEVAGNCFDIKEVGTHLDTILALINAGLISTVSGRK